MILRRPEIALVFFGDAATSRDASRGDERYRAPEVVFGEILLPSFGPVSITLASALIDLFTNRVGVEIQDRQFFCRLCLLGDAEGPTVVSALSGRAIPRQGESSHVQGVTRRLP